MDTSRERETVSKVTWRLIPFLFLCYIIAYIDRINVGFAGLQLQKAFGVDASRYYVIYGWGAGLFFIGYLYDFLTLNEQLSEVNSKY